VFLDDDYDEYGGALTRVCVRNAAIDDMLVLDKASPFRRIVASTLTLDDVEGTCGVLNVEIQTAKTGTGLSALIL
jgi:hypothetical protein